MRKEIVLILILALFVCTACSDGVKSEESDRPYVVGYFPTWKEDFTPEWDKITHLCLAFGLVQESGEVDISSVVGHKELIKEAQSNNVEVLLSIGGGGSKNFTAAILDSGARVNLINNLGRIVEKYGLDGVDVDYEEWDGDLGGASEHDIVKREALEQTYIALREELGGEKLITAAVNAGFDGGDGGWGYYNCFNNTMHEHLDMVNLMIYDMTGPWSKTTVGAHSGWDFFESAIDHWLNNRKLPKEKLVAGVPFYGYEFQTMESGEGARSVGYGDLVERYADQDAHLKDSIGMLYYDGMVTMERKAEYIKENKLGGIMIWEITRDAKEPEKRLLNVIDRTFKE